MLRFPTTFRVLIQTELQNLIKADRYIGFAPVVYHSIAFYVLGGVTDEDVYNSNIIGRLDTTTLTWAKAGELIYARHGYGAIFTGDVMVVAGGHDDHKSLYKTESCEFINGFVTCIELTATLNDYAYFPEMHLVSDTFCKNI